MGPVMVNVAEFLTILQSLEITRKPKVLQQQNCKDKNQKEADDSMILIHTQILLRLECLRQRSKSFCPNFSQLVPRKGKPSGIVS